MEDSDIVLLEYDLSIQASYSSEFLLEYDLSIPASYSSEFLFIIGPDTQTELIAECTLPNQITDNYLNRAYLIQHISFYNESVTLNNDEIEIIINQLSSNIYNIEYVGYRDSTNHSGYYKTQVLVLEMQLKSITYTVSLPSILTPSLTVEENILSYGTFYEDGEVGNGTKGAIIKTTDRVLYEIQYYYTYTDYDSTQRTIYTDTYEVTLLMTVIEIPSTIKNISKLVYFKKEDYREQTDINIFLYNFIGAGFNGYYK